MVTRIGGQRRKTRGKFSKRRRQQGKLSLRAYLQELEPGTKVALKAEPSIQRGLYFRRFHGRVGEVARRLGTCYEVLVRDGSKEKKLIVHPVHLRRLA